MFPWGSSDHSRETPVTKQAACSNSIATTVFSMRQAASRAAEDIPYDR
jgi:hypothetical protein